MPPAVDRDRLARDPSRHRRHEECDEAGDLVGRARPAERVRRFARSRNSEYLPSSMPPRRWRFVTVTPGLTALMRTPFGAKSERGDARELIDRRFAHAVRRHAGERAQGR
jgi:hypothetical protein